MVNGASERDDSAGAQDHQGVLAIPETGRGKKGFYSVSESQKDVALQTPSSQFPPAEARDNTCPLC